ncbi:conserved hypothetical protein [Vibrio jasicida]|uniref:Competence protein CoiA-like N-terminal domain-containing protein n=1 Tax=Vibrio jasicida TaxID=766224 RepID=A0AAU9QTW4_9VIBR|nr:conserved hypothetical protein [Vibrio jasicida]CAH1601865.1 conserved hypothetical protein [Vibrio jasicida]
MALIPFGLKNGRLVDISSVERGLKCGCVCPSCGQRLVARFGVEMIPHFAHDKNAESQGVNTEPCALSFWVALRLMIKQVANEQGYLKLKVPNLVVTSYGRDNDYNPVEISMQVSSEIDLKITDIQHQVVVDSTNLDLVGLVGGAMFGIHFVYPGRRNCIGDFSSRIGVLEIDLTRLEWIYENYDFIEQPPFENRVLEYLYGSLEAKKWYYHPSYLEAKSRTETQLAREVEQRNIANAEHARQKDRDKHQQQLKISQEQDRKRSKLLQLSDNGDWYCCRCNSSWLREDKGESCPNCYMPGQKIIIR